MGKIKEKLSVSLSVEDFLRRFFLVELREQNLDELISLSLNFSDKFKNITREYINIIENK